MEMEMQSDRDAQKEGKKPLGGGADAAVIRWAPIMCCNLFKLKHRKVPRGAGPPARQPGLCWQCHSGSPESLGEGTA